MAIAIAVTAPEVTAQIAMHGVRAPFLLLFDDAGNLHTVLANPFVQAERGAESQVADILEEHGVKLVAASGIGTEFISALEARQIAYTRKFGRVSEVIGELVAKLAKLFHAIPVDADGSPGRSEHFKEMRGSWALCL